MPGCVLRIGGNFTAAELLARCPLPRVARADDGCVLALVSGAESSNIHTQVGEALEFLAAFSCTLQKISSLPGLGMELDFGVWIKDVPIQSIRFPSALVKAAGNLGIELVISLYVSDDGEV